MKKIVFATLFSVLGLNLMAQEDYGRSMAISVAPLKAVAGTAALVYQAKLTDYLALTVPAHFSYHWTAGHAFKLFKQGEVAEATKKPISYGLGLGARFLLSGNGLNDSFYLEPGVAFSYNQLGYKFKEGFSAEFERYQIGPNFRFGWDWYYDSGLYLNLGLDLGYSFFLKNDVKESDNVDAKRDSWVFNQAFPKKDALGLMTYGIDFAIGYSW